MLSKHKDKLGILFIGVYSWPIEVGTLSHHKQASKYWMIKKIIK